MIRRAFNSGACPTAGRKLPLSRLAHRNFFRCGACPGWISREPGFLLRPAERPGLKHAAVGLRGDDAALLAQDAGVADQVAVEVRRVNVGLAQAGP